MRLHGCSRHKLEYAKKCAHLLSGYPIGQDGEAALKYLLDFTEGLELPRNNFDLPKVVELTETCVGCPSQWEGKTDFGNAVYIRYRFGQLVVGLGTTLEDAVANAGDEPLHAATLGDELDGTLHEQDMKEALAGVLAFAN